MSVQLWRFYLENDVVKFRHFLAQANYSSHGPRTTTVPSAGNTTSKVGSPSTLATSPRTPVKGRKSFESRIIASHGKGASLAGQSLTRADINSRDANGCTILHHAVSSLDENAYSFIEALLEVPFVDLYIQDLESGWTPLHRALYFGNVSAALAIMLRDIRDATDYTSGMAHSHLGGLVKIKDHEGNSPFEVFGLTVGSRDLHRDYQTIGAGTGDDDLSSLGDAHVDGDEEGPRSKILKARVNLRGDELFTFGSNKNLTLGLGDEDDRQFPERPPFDRPLHLSRRFHQDLLERQAKLYEALEIGSSQLVSLQEEIPAVIKHQSLTIQDVLMSKLSTAILTNDPESNLFMTGYGPGGRLGTGDESTRFKFECIVSGGLAGKKVIGVALGQDHTIAVSDRGEVFTWGSNKNGQLGYTLPPPNPGQDFPTQLVPRQLFGPMKKEVIIGASASTIHSAIYTSTALYTFGKNDGQLGLMDADARSLGVQVSPRRVGVNVLQSFIESASAIDQATVVLLENHDVIVFTHYAWTRVVFPLESFDSRVMTGTVPNQSLRSNLSNFINKVTCGGNTICALSKFGEVFTVDVSQRPDVRAAGTSTTHPVKAKNALPTPSRIWSIKKSHMAAKDVAVGQNGSIILCTESGSVWRKEKRTQLKEANKSRNVRGKDYKFVRVPTLTRVAAVRSNAFGAFAAVRKDSDVTKEQIDVDPQTLWGDLLPLLPFRDFKLPDEDSDEENPRPRFWTPLPSGRTPSTIKQAILLSKDIEADIQHVLSQHEPLNSSQYDVLIASDVSDVEIPVHAFMLAARSSILRRAFEEFHQSYYFSIPDILSIEYGKGGQICMLFHGADFLTLLNLAFYTYCENVIDVWHYTRKSPQSAARFRQIRREVMDIAQNLDMKGLERAARLQVDPSKRLHLDLELAFADEAFFINGDIAIQLSGDIEIKAHSPLVCLRCPFFEGMFHGRAGGKWVASRRDAARDGSEVVLVDLKHVDPDVFTLVLRHVYADTGEELFDEVVTKGLDEFLDIVLEVMYVANELMLDRLAQITQRILGRYVNIRNVCYLLNAVAPCTEDEFKKVALEYICLNLEVMLENRLLEELDKDLLLDIDAIVQSNQISQSLIARSGKADEELFEAHPELAEQVEIARQRKIDSMRLKTRLHEDEERASKFRVGSIDKSPNLSQRRSSEGKGLSASPDATPALRPKQSANELLFDMDGEEPDDVAGSGFSLNPSSPSIRPQDLDDNIPLSTPKDNDWTEVRGKSASRSFTNNLSNISEILTSRSPVGKSRETTRPLTTTTGFVAKPWSSKPTAEKTNLKDIMAQASSNRVSGLSLAMMSDQQEAAKPSFGSKMSQKERKKMHHQQQSQEKLENQQPSRPWTTNEISNKPRLPWQSVRTPAAPVPLPSDPSSAPMSGASPRSSPKPGMTLRQTVAGAPAVGTSPKSSNISTQTKQPQRTPSGSTPGQPQSHPLRPSSSTHQQPTKPTTSTSIIQSIRHIPPTQPSSFTATSKTSLFDILNQQQSEKTAIQEARTEKRSLQDIQAEQEFMQWWDEESQRVKEDEERTKKLTERSERSSTGRGAGSAGKRGRAGGGRGGRGGKSDGGDQARQNSETNHREDGSPSGSKTARSSSGPGGGKPSRATKLSLSREREMELEKEREQPNEGESQSHNEQRLLKSQISAISSRPRGGGPGPGRNRGRGTSNGKQ